MEATKGRFYSYCPCSFTKKELIIIFLVQMMAALPLSVLSKEKEWDPAIADLIALMKKEDKGSQATHKPCF